MLAAVGFLLVRDVDHFFFKWCRTALTGHQICHVLVDAQHNFTVNRGRARAFEAGLV